MRLTKKRVKELHTELWLWLAENPRKEKIAWPRWKFNGGDIPEIRANCFPCEYSGHICKCPLDFPEWGQVGSGCLGGLYDRWAVASGKKRSALAKQIAELPLRKGR